MKLVGDAPVPECWKEGPAHTRECLDSQAVRGSPAPGPVLSNLGPRNGL
jgi:hypothetical protein